MTSSTDEEMNDLAAAVMLPEQFAQFSPQPLWPNPNWSQEAAMIAYEIHRLRNELSDARFIAQNFQKRWGNLCDQLSRDGWTLQAVEQASSRGLPEGDDNVELSKGHQLAAQWRARAESLDRVGNHVIADVLRECANELDQYHE